MALILYAHELRSRKLGRARSVWPAEQIAKFEPEQERKIPPHLYTSPISRPQNADYNRLSLVSICFHHGQNFSLSLVWSAQVHFKPRKRFAGTLLQIDISPTSDLLQSSSSPGTRLDPKASIQIRENRLPLLYEYTSINVKSLKDQ